jgi:pimeloyl-ACP methyl ester carboxylesterase
MTLGRQKRVKLRGCSYSVWTSIKGPLVVLLHGWPVTSYHWRFLVPALHRAGFSTICIDLRGLGQSTCRNDGRFEKEKLAKDVKDLLEVLYPNLTSYSVIGHDWGATVAVALASLDQNRIKKLVAEEEILPGLLVKIAEPGAKYYPVWHGGFHRTPRLPEQVILGREESYIGYFLRLRRDPLSLSSKDFKHYLKFYKGTRQTMNWLSYYRTNKADSKFYQNLTRRKLSVPTLAIGGKYAMGPAVGDSLRLVASDVQSKVLKKSGHYPAEEERNVFAKTVISFLR